MHHRKTYMYISFQQNRVSRSVKTCTQVYLQKITLAIRILEKSRLSDMHYPLTDIHAHFEINRPIRYRNIAKRIISTDGRTDRRTDRRRARQQ